MNGALALMLQSGGFEPVAEPGSRMYEDALVGKVPFRGRKMLEGSAWLETGF